MITVTHFASNLEGGALIAARRIHQAVADAGCNSRLISGGIAGLSGGNAEDRPAPLWLRLANAVQRSIEHRRWNANSYQFFTSPRWWPRTPIQLFGPLPDIINLHLVIRWLDLPVFFKSVPRTLPVVWSLHDLNPVTGGCHHPMGCEQYTSHCRNCPALRKSGPEDLSFKYFKIKKNIYQKINLYLVANSSWTSVQAQKSALTQYVRGIYTVPLGVDTDTYRPIEKNIARAALGINSETFVVGFAAAQLSDENKNGRILVDAMDAISDQCPGIILAHGSGTLILKESRCKIIELGKINSERMQAIFYSACDVFAVPSRIESFGLTALEAMACGTPVIAFKTGALSEIILDGITGILENNIGNTIAFSKHIQWMQMHPQERHSMGIQARIRACQYYSSTLMGSRYIKIYKNLLEEAR